MVCWSRTNRRSPDLCHAAPVRIDVFTIFPEMVEDFADRSLLGRARARGLLDVRAHDLRSQTRDPHRTVDDAPFGGGAGMVLMPEPLFACVEAAEPLPLRRLLLGLALALPLLRLLLLALALALLRSQGSGGSGNPVLSRSLVGDLQPLAEQHPGLVYLAPAVVGTSDSGMV